MSSMRVHIFIILLISTTYIISCEGTSRKVNIDDLKPVTSKKFKPDIFVDERVKNTSTTLLPNDWRSSGVSEFAGIVDHGSLTSASASIAIFSPGSVTSGEFTISFISIESGEGSDFNGFQIGWAVNPDFYKDSEIHFFIFKVNHGSCADNACTDFEYNDRSLKFGDILTPSEVGRENQNYLDLYIYQDTGSKLWHVEANSKTLGIWSGQSFTSLQNGATTIRFGGEAYTPKGWSSSPPMGSGSMNYPGMRPLTAYFEDVTVNGVAPQNPQIVETRCYVVADAGSTEFFEGYGFFFGGSGGSDEGGCAYP
ncbi:hypothetical protein RND81_02G081200 [Saponaria officinalis]|uniref:Neprosin PEP catalytic domain-containing protein n=1 Tax=Saponaria officinalis TaxID=3572 RepID=A0AAW1MS77_SAPOF